MLKFRKIAFSWIFFLLAFCGCQEADEKPNDQELSHTHLNQNIIYGEVTDIDGNIYKTVQIGSTTWMAENLRTSRFCNGDIIPNPNQTNDWINSGNSKNPAWIHYNNNSSNDYPFGKLYNWYAFSDSRNICPCGWRIPTIQDWKTLANNLGSNAGGKMKSLGTEFWKTPNTGATNESGFSALPSGTIWPDGQFRLKTEVGGFWVDGSLGGDWSETVSLIYNSGEVFGVGEVEEGTQKIQGLSVRCIKVF